MNYDLIAETVGVGVGEGGDGILSTNLLVIFITILLVYVFKYINFAP